MALPITDPTNVVAVATNLVTAATNAVATFTNPPTIGSNSVTTVTNVVVSNITGLDVVNQVKDYFSISYTHTLWLVGAMLTIAGFLLTILGFVIPAAYYFLQKQQMALDKKAIGDQLKTDIAHLEATLRQANTKMFSDEKAAMQKSFLEIELKIKQESSIARGRSFHLQGNFLRDKGRHAEAVESYAKAIEGYAEGSRLKAVQQVMRLMTGLLAGLKKTHFDTSGVELSVNETTQIIAKLESNGLLDADVNAMNKAMLAAKSREK